MLDAPEYALMESCLDMVKERNGNGYSEKDEAKLNYLHEIRLRLERHLDSQKMAREL